MGKKTALRQERLTHIEKKKSATYTGKGGAR